jgi:hypothetical protein
LIGLNAEIGNASKEIVEASSRDSAAMNAIAEDSKKVAFVTRHDSTNTRITTCCHFTLPSGNLHCSMLTTLSPLGLLIQINSLPRLSSALAFSTFESLIASRLCPGGYGSTPLS